MSHAPCVLLDMCRLNRCCPFSRLYKYFCDVLEVQEHKGTVSRPGSPSLSTMCNVGGTVPDWIIGFSTMHCLLRSGQQTPWLRDALKMEMESGSMHSTSLRSASLFGFMLQLSGRKMSKAGFESWAEGCQKASLPPEPSVSQGPPCIGVKAFKSGSACSLRVRRVLPYGLKQFKSITSLEPMRTSRELSHAGREGHGSGPECLAILLSDYRSTVRQTSQHGLKWRQPGNFTAQAVISIFELSRPAVKHEIHGNDKHH